MLSFAEKFLAGGVQFMSVIVISRLLSPAEVGTYSIAASAVGFAHVIRDFGVSNYLIQARELTDEKVRAALTVTCAVAWLIAALLLMASNLIARFYAEPAITTIVIVLAASFVIIPLSSTILAVLRRQMRFGALSLINTASTLVHATTAILLAWLGFGPISLGWASLTGIVTTALLALLVLPSGAHLRPGFRGTAEVFAFGWRSSGASILHELGDSGPSLVVGRMLGLDAAGLLSRAEGLVGIFGRVILQGIQPVILPALTLKLREEGDLSKTVLQAMSSMAILAWPFSWFLIVFSNPLILLIFGEKWLGAGPLLRVLGLLGFSHCINAVAWPALVAIGRLDLLLRAQAISQPLLVACVLIASFRDLRAVALAIVISKLFGSLLYLIYSRREMGFSWRDGGRAAARALLVSGVSVGAAQVAYGGLAGVDLPLLLRVAVTCGTFCVAWLAVIFLLRDPLAAEFAGLVARFRQRVGD
jgi:O-antigen/teichoic acid export membrane protein